MNKMKHRNFLCVICFLISIGLSPNNVDAQEPKTGVTWKLKQGEKANEFQLVRKRMPRKNWYRFGTESAFEIHRMHGNCPVGGITYTSYFGTWKMEGDTLLVCYDMYNQKVERDFQIISKSRKKWILLEISRPE